MFERQNFLPLQGIENLGHRKRVPSIKKIFKLNICQFRGVAQLVAH